MPDYMCDMVTDYVCKSKKDAILNELVHYIRTHKYKNKRIKKKMHALITEIIPSKEIKLTSEAIDILLSTPILINIALTHTNRCGLEMFVKFSYNDIVSESHTTDIYFEFYSRKKRTRSTSLFIVSVDETHKKIDSFHDTKEDIQHKEMCKRILFAHLTKKSMLLLDNLFIKNSWKNLKQFVGELFLTKIKEKHIPIHFNIDFKSSNGESIDVCHII